MILDKDLMFSDAQTILDSGASTNYIDLEVAGEDAPEEMYLLIQVATAVTRAAGAATVTFKLQSDSDAAFGSATDMFTSAAIAKASLTAGYQAVKVRIPHGSERYLRVYYTFSAACDTGAFNAMLVQAVEKRYSVS